MRKTYVPLAKGEEIAGRLATLLRASGAAVYVVGSIRRKASRVGDIDFVAVSEKPASALLRGVEGLQFDSGGEGRAFGYFEGMAVNLWTCPETELGAALFNWTGPTGYIIHYRKLAQEMGLHLDQHGLWQDDILIISDTEEAIFVTLGKPYKPPELRGR